MNQVKQVSAVDWDPFAEPENKQATTTIPIVDMKDASAWKPHKILKEKEAFCSLGKKGVLRGNKSAIELMSMTPEMKYMDIVLLERNLIGIAPKVHEIKGKTAKIGWSKNGDYIAISIKTFFKTHESEISLPEKNSAFKPIKVEARGFGIYYAFDLKNPIGNKTNSHNKQ